MVQDLRELLRLLSGREAQPSAVILDSRKLHLAGFHLVDFVILMVKQFVEIKFQSA